MSLSKQQREYYLHSMGIQPWSARLAIQKNTHSPAALDKSKIMPRADMKALQPIKASINSKPLAQQIIQPLPQTGNLARFNLAFLVYSDLLMISELPLHEHKIITPPQLRLLKSVRLSLGYSASEPAQTFIMNWPLVENNKIDQGEDAAFVAVQAQLKKQMEKYKPKYLALFGSAACRYILGLTTSFDDVRGKLIANETLCAAITYSVNELLKVPSLKSSAWHDLQDVRKTSK
jgi:hypothetical protein